MSRQDFPIVGGYNILRSIEYDSEDTINFYIVEDPTAKKPQSLQPMPGTLLAVSLLNGKPIRENGLYPFNGNFYAISGNVVYKIDSNLTPQVISNAAPLATFTGLISWANSPAELAIVDGINLYSYNPLTGIFQIIATIQGAGFPVAPQMIYYQDARFILSFKDNPEYFYSGFADTTMGALEKWDAQNVFIQQSRPDTSIGIIGANERLFLFGHQSVESWIPFTTPNLLPFYRDNNFIYEFGCAAQGSILKGVLDVKDSETVSSFVYWLSANPQGAGSFVITAGGNTYKLSSEAIDLRLETYEVVSDCVSTLYKSGGHIFIENTFQNDNETLVVDLKTAKWFRKETIRGDRSTINSHVFYNRKHYVGTYLDGNIYELSDKHLDNNGEQIRHARSTMTFQDPTYRRIEGHLFEVDFEAGQVDQLQNPIAFLSVSYDGGRTYGNQMPAQIGQIGEYRWKAQWLGLGISYMFTFKIEVYDAVRVYIFGAAFDWDVCQE